MANGGHLSFLLSSEDILGFFQKENMLSKRWTYGNISTESNNCAQWGT